MASAPVVLAPQPPKPARNYSFTDWQVNNPTAPPPGDKLDSEYDQGYGAISGVIDWTATSLNTDGTIRDGVIGENQLVPGLFDNISTDAIADVQPYVDQAQAAAASAVTSKNAAANSAGSAASSVTLAQNSAGTASSAAAVATAARDTAQTYANTATSEAQSAANAASDAEGDAAKAEDWADVSVAWAEHMPDTIPPNILAIMGVTGEHWSSRWWANQADLTVQEGLSEINDAVNDGVADLQKLYLGAFPTPPTTDNQGNPLTVGAVYYDTTQGTTYVWTGTIWTPVTPSGPFRVDPAGVSPPPVTVRFVGDTGGIPTLGSELMILSADANNARLHVVSGGGFPIFSAEACGGALTAPRPTNAGQTIMLLTAGGHDGHQWLGARAQIRFDAESDWTSFAQPTNIQFFVTPPGTNTRLEAARISADMTLLVGKTTSSGLAHMEVVGGAMFDTANLSGALTGATGAFTGRVSAADPVNPTDLVNLRYMRANAGTGTGGGTGGGIEEAPSDGVTYGRKNTFWAPVLSLFNDTLDGGNF